MLTYLCCAHLRQHNVEQVKALAPKSKALAGELAFPEYAGMAKAMLAWAAWKEGQYIDAEALAEEARRLWRTCVVHYSWCWAGLWPLVAVRLDDGRLEQAVAAARELLGADQQRFPEALESAVESALDTWDRGDTKLAAKRLSRRVGPGLPAPVRLSTGRAALAGQAEPQAYPEAPRRSGRFCETVQCGIGQPILTKPPRRSAATTASSTCSTAPPVRRGYGRWPAFADGKGEFFQFRHEHGGDVVAFRAWPNHGGVGISGYGLAFSLDLEVGEVRPSERHPPRPAVDIDVVKEPRRSLGH